MRPLLIFFATALLAGCPNNTSPTDSGSDTAVDAGADTMLADVAADAPTSDVAPTDATPIDVANDTPSPDVATADVTDATADTADTTAGCDDTAVTTRLTGLLFTSEGDFPLEYAIFPGDGASAPTVATVATLSGASASATTETRDEAWFWTHVVVDPTHSPPAPDSQITELRAAFEALASDRIVVRVIEPSDPARVHVYLAGRTACGALVWLASISIET